MSVIRQQDEMLELTKTRQIHHRSPKRSLAPVSARIKARRAVASGRSSSGLAARWLPRIRRAMTGLTSAMVADKDWGADHQWPPPTATGVPRYSLGIRTRIGLSS